MGLVRASATLKKTMDIVLSGLNFDVCLVYLDDIIIYSDSVEVHLERFQKVFERLRIENLKLKPDKCRLLKNQVQFLSHVMAVEGISADPDKTLPTPTCLKEVRAFIWLCSYYRKFVPPFPHLAAPLCALSKKNQVFSGTTDVSNHLKLLKSY